LSAVHAKDYYVSPTGNDSNSGTRAQPWRTIAKVNGTDFGPGDSILFEGGKAFGGTIELDEKDAATAQERITVSSYGTGPANIDGGDRGAFVANGCSHIIVKDINFVGSGRRAGNTETGVWAIDCDDVEFTHIEVSGFQKSGLSAEGSRDVRITHVHAHDNRGAGIRVGASRRRWSEKVHISYCIAENNPGDPTNLTGHSGNGIVVGQLKKAVIEYCEAHNNGWDMPRRGNGPVGIWAWSADEVVIQFCISHDNKSPGHDGGGFDLDGGVTNSILQYNLSYGNEGPGYFLCQYPTAPAFRDNVVRYNISQDDGTKNNRRSGIDIYAGDVGMSDCQIYNNTVYNRTGAAVAFGGLDVEGIVIRNNIFIFGGELISGDSKRGRFENNVYWRIDDRDILFDGHRILEEWADATGQEKIGDEIVGKVIDPKLVDAGLARLADPTKLSELAEYKLRTDSPCIGVGIIVEDNGGRDLWGSEVPRDRKPSIGACQKP